MLFMEHAPTGWVGAVGKLPSQKDPDEYFHFTRFELPLNLRIEYGPLNQSRCFFSFA